MPVSLKIIVSSGGVNEKYARSLCVALAELGHTVRFLEDRFSWRVGLAKLGSYIPLRIGIANYHREYRDVVNRRLLKEARLFRPSFVLVVGGEYVTFSTVEQIQKELHIPVACWVLEEPAAADIYHPFGWMNYSSYSRLFVIDELWTQSLQLFPAPKTYLPIAGDDAVYKSLDIKKDIEVLFVGSFFPEDRHIVSGFGRAVLLDCLNRAGFSVKVVGNGAKKIRFFFPHLKVDAVEDSRAFSLNELYNRAKVVIYINPLLLKTDFDQHVFEIALSGAFFITDRKVNALKLFENELSVIHAPEELISETKRFLGDPAERDRIRKNVRSIALRRHTYRRRAEELIGYLYNNA